MAVQKSYLVPRESEAPGALVPDFLLYKALKGMLSCEGVRNTFIEVVEVDGDVE